MQVLYFQKKKKINNSKVPRPHNIPSKWKREKLNLMSTFITSVLADWNEIHNRDECVFLPNKWLITLIMMFYQWSISMIQSYNYFHWNWVDPSVLGYNVEESLTNTWTFYPKIFNLKMVYEYSTIAQLKSPGISRGNPSKISIPD